MEELRKLICVFLAERGWDNPRPADVAKSISIEAAELLELFQWSNETPEELLNDSQKLEDVRYELADIFIYFTAMCHLLGLDPREFVVEKLQLLDEKYPAHLMKSRKHKGNKDRDPYYRRKAEHRSEE